jgi:hypothetical protein
MHSFSQDMVKRGNLSNLRRGRRKPNVECRICAIRDIRGSPNSSCLLVSIRGLTPFSGNCGAKFSKIMKKMIRSWSNRPIFAPNFLEVQRGMKRVPLPQAIIFPRQCANWLRQLVVSFPELRAPGTWKAHFSSLNMRSSESHRPALKSFSARRFISSNLPAAASAFICLSHSSSGRGGCSSAINSQYSSGESLAMASLISATVDMMEHTKPDRPRQVRRG